MTDYPPIPLDKMLVITFVMVIYFSPAKVVASNYTHLYYMHTDLCQYTYFGEHSRHQSTVILTSTSIPYKSIGQTELDFYPPSDTLDNFLLLSYINLEISQ